VPTSESPLLDVEQLTVRYSGRRRSQVVAVDDVSFAVRPGQTVGLVGESGSGKSSIGKAILGLVKPAAGSIRFDGRDIVERDLALRRSLAHQLQVVFQDPNSSLNPTRTIASSLMEPLLVGRDKGRETAREKAGAMLERVGLTRDAMERYPSAFSGGQRQRIAIARALVMEPRLIICDEPVSALDLSVQARVLNLLVDLQLRDNLSFLFISHDLSVVRHMSHYVLVLQRGKVVEHGTGDQLWNSPEHPYTRALIASVPDPNPAHRQDGRASVAI
jgi:ABC-type glutathione transport system ATPase component